MTIRRPLPAGWEQVTLRQLNQLKVGSMDPSRYPEEQFEYYSIPAYQNAVRPIMAMGHEILSQKLLIPANCLLFGKLNPRVEKVWNVKSSSALKRLASTEWLPIVPNANLYQDFGYYLLRSEWVMPLAKALVSGSTPSRERVEPKAFYDIEVPLPPNNEQRKIALCLSGIDLYIKKQGELIDAANDLKHATMHKLFTCGLRGEPQKETEIGLVPERWRYDALGDIVDIDYGIQAAVANATDPSIGTLILTNVNIDLDGSINLEKRRYYDIPENSKERYLLKKNDVLFNWRSGSENHVGKTAYFDLDIAATYSSFILRFRPKAIVTPGYLFRWLRFLHGSGFFSSKRNVSSINSVYNASLSATIPIFSPRDTEQQEIVDILDAIDQKIDLHRRKKAVLEELFKSLLHKLMTGEVRVDDLDLSALEDMQPQAQGGAA